MQDEPIVGLYLDIRSASKKNGGKFHSKVRITWMINGEPDVRYLLTKQFLTREEFDIIEAGKAKTSTLRESQEKIFLIRSNTKSIIDKNKRIGIDQFFFEYDKQFGAGKDSKIRNPLMVAVMLDDLIEEKNLAEDTGTAISYGNAKVSFLKFTGPNILVSDITPELLKGYELWMTDQQKKKRSLNTVGFYLKPVRTVCKRARDKHHLTTEQYPFGKGKYVIRKKRVKKRGLSPLVKNNILNFKASSDAEARAIDFAMFSFIAHGMNMTDIAYLRKENFLSDRIKYVRRKTRKTVLVQKEIEVPLSKPLREIMMRRATFEGFVFGIITDEMDHKERKRRINQHIHVINNWLKKIAGKIGYTDKVTTYSLRHTFTSILVNANIPLTKVKDTLGHQSILTTQEYAEDLGHDEATGFTDILTA